MTDVKGFQLTLELHPMRPVSAMLRQCPTFLSLSLGIDNTARCKILFMRLTLNDSAAARIPVSEGLKVIKKSEKLHGEGNEQTLWEKAFPVAYPSLPNLFVHCHILYLLCSCQSPLQNCKLLDVGEN